MYEQRIFVIADGYWVYREWLNRENLRRPYNMILIPDRDIRYIHNVEKLRGIRGGYFILLPRCADLPEFNDIMHMVRMIGMEEMTYNELKGYYDASRTVLDVMGMISNRILHFSVNGIYNKYD